jgi:putative ABC transport system substrate-binding protein
MRFDHLSRREFVMLLGGATALAPLTARAQERLPIVGILRINPKEVEVFAEPFRRDIKELGWEEGRNIRVELAWAGGRNEDVPALARDLVARQAEYHRDVRESGNLGGSTRHRDDPDCRDDR